jgi:hypothetical protein
MVKYKISTEYKKSIVEVNFWYKDGMTIRRETGWRWGSGDVILVDNDEEENFLAAVQSEEVDVYDYEFELDSLDDGCWEDVEYPEDMSEEERERLDELWNDEPHEGWENEGWSLDDAELWFTGPIKLEKVEE